MPARGQYKSHCIWQRRCVTVPASASVGAFLNSLPGSSHTPRRLVIIGGGIGGTTVAKRLANHPGF
jgi:hypothetical protein